jgi:hypothetical protein
MIYSKHFKHDGIIIIFDKSITSEEYPLFYIAVREGNKKHSVFIPKRKFKAINTIKTETIKIVMFSYA